MAAFLVISADNRLHHIVDGIEKCRPLDSAVKVSLSTGKIIDEDGNLTYRYTLSGVSDSEGDKKDFSHLLANQLAQFRLLYHIANNDIVNIFLLENPLTDSDFEKGKWWQEEFQKVYEDGHDKCFRLFRVLFSYDVLKPADVVEQVCVDNLKHVLSKSGNDGLTFESFVFYIDNQKCDAAALCANKEDHDLKIPRMLCDFMMLASNTNDTYGILQSILNLNTEETNRAFSIGYAESMYYYSDVKEYFLKADERDLHRRMLLDEDETTSDMKDKDRMRAERYPFGLQNRMQTMKPRYEDVPFTEDINDYEESADKVIDDCLLKLKDSINAERNQELEAFKNTDVMQNLIAKKDKALFAYEELRNLPHDQRDETYEEQIKQKELEIEVVGNQIAEMLDSFDPECPEFICRNDIYAKVESFDDEEELETFLQDERIHYQRLVDYARSKSFADYVKKDQEKPEPQVAGVVIDSSSEPEKEGCWSKLFSLFRKKKHQPVEEQRQEPVIATMPHTTMASDWLRDITKCLNLKKQYVSFCSEVDAMAKLVEDETDRLKDFRLTDHTSHFYHLIDLAALRRFQEENSKTRLDSMIEDWRTVVQSDSQTRTSVENRMHKASLAYSEQFQFVDWNDPFVFVNKPTASDFANIVNELYKMSAPCAHYNKVNIMEQSVITNNIYSDFGELTTLFNTHKSKIANAGCIRPVVSRHIASKICFMQFLPMDESIIECLADLKMQESV